MSDSTNTRGRKKRWAGAVGLLAAGVISGGGGRIDHEPNRYLLRE